MRQGPAAGAPQSRSCPTRRRLSLPGRGTSHGTVSHTWRRRTTSSRPLRIDPEEATSTVRERAARGVGESGEEVGSTRWPAAAVSHTPSHGRVNRERERQTSRATSIAMSVPSGTRIRSVAPYPPERADRSDPAREVLVVAVHASEIREVTCAAMSALLCDEAQSVWLSTAPGGPKSPSYPVRPTVGHGAGA
jgi:hypothetical protein